MGAGGREPDRLCVHIASAMQFRRRMSEMTVLISSSPDSSTGPSYVFHLTELSFSTNIL
jgi:hypothetical protein